MLLKVVLWYKERKPLSPVMQVSTDPAAADPAAKHGQRNVMPRWPERQQVGQDIISMRGVTAVLHSHHKDAGPYRYWHAGNRGCGFSVWEAYDKLHQNPMATGCSLC